jgi:hypothetical protein
MCAASLHTNEHCLCLGKEALLERFGNLIQISFQISLSQTVFAFSSIAVVPGPAVQHVPLFQLPHQYRSLQLPEPIFPAWRSPRDNSSVTSLHSELLRNSNMLMLSCRHVHHQKLVQIHISLDVVHNCASSVLEPFDPKCEVYIQPSTSQRYHDTTSRSDIKRDDALAPVLSHTSFFCPIYEHHLPSQL